MSNKGIEAIVSYRKRFDNGLQIQTSLNLSHIVNKITDLNGASPIISDAKAQVEGHAINAFYGYKMDETYIKYLILHGRIIMIRVFPHEQRNIF